MGEFTLKPGARFQAIIDGEFVEKIGDNEGTVKVTLNDEQFDAFSDKLLEGQRPKLAPTPDAEEKPAAPAAAAAKK